MDVDMLYPDVLLPFAAMTLEYLDLSSEGAQQLHCEVPISSRSRNVSDCFWRRCVVMIAACVATICVASIPSISSLAPIPVTAANTWLMSRSLGGFPRLASHAAFRMPLSIRSA